MGLHETESETETGKIPYTSPRPRLRPVSLARLETRRESRLCLLCTPVIKNQLKKNGNSYLNFAFAMLEIVYLVVVGIKYLILFWWHTFDEETGWLLYQFHEKTEGESRQKQWRFIKFLN